MRPDTYDQFAFVKYCLENGDQYYVQVPRPDPEDENRTVQTLVPLSDLTPDEWTQNVRNWYYMASFPVRTLEEWSQQIPQEQS